MNRAFILLSLCSFLLLRGAEAADYKIINLGTFGGNRSIATAINDNGQIVGCADTSIGYTHAFLWQNGLMRDIDTHNGTFSCADGINDSGTVVGRYYPGPYDVAFVWQTETMTDLCAHGSYACDINDNGQIAGYAAVSPTDYFYHPCIWEGQNLNVLNSLSNRGGSGARSINNHGEAVGSGCTRDQCTHAVLWQDQNTVDLGTLPVCDYSEALSINDNRQIVGRSGSNGFYKAFIWQDGIMSELSTPATDDSIACGINNNAQIVGVCGNNAVLWQNGGITVLDTLGGSWAAAYGINDNGWIVGESSDANGNSYAVLWQPVPEPSSILTLLCGFCGMAGIVCKRRSA